VYSFDSKVTIGYMGTQAGSKDRSVKFTRWPLEYVANYVLGKNRLGAGLSYHLNPTLDQSDFDYENAKFENALGYVAEYDYRLGAAMSVMLRYEFIKYKLSNYSREKVDGSHFGIGFNGEFF
jgi:hypothetical protein